MHWQWYRYVTAANHCHGRREFKGSCSYSKTGLNFYPSGRLNIVRLSDNPSLEVNPQGGGAAVD